MLYLFIYLLINSFFAGYEYGTELQAEYAAGNRAKAIIVTLAIMAFCGVVMAGVLLVVLYQKIVDKK